MSAELFKGMSIHWIKSPPVPLSPKGEGFSATGHLHRAPVSGGPDKIGVAGEENRGVCFFSIFQLASQTLRLSFLAKAGVKFIRSAVLCFIPLVVFAASSSGQESELQERREFMRRLTVDVDNHLRGFREEPYVEDTPLEPVEESWRQLGFIPFVREYGRSVYPNTVPARSERGGALAAFAAPGESEPLAFGVRTLEIPLEGVRLSCEGLANLDTLGFIPPEAIEFGVVEYWRVRWGEGSSARLWRWHPTRIWPSARFPGDGFGRVGADGEMTLAARAARSFRVTVRTPEDAPAGKYVGEVVLESCLGAHRFPVEFTVLPLTLERTGREIVGMMMSGPQDAASCRALAALGVTATSQWYDPDFLPLIRERGSLTFDYTLQDAYMHRLAGAGLDGPHLVFAGSASSPRFDNALAETTGIAIDSTGYLQSYALAVQGIFSQARQAGWPPPVWGILDRLAAGGSGIDWFNSRAGELRRIAGGAVSLVSPIIAEALKTASLDSLVDYRLAGGDAVLRDRASGQHQWGFDTCTQRDSASAARWRVGFGPWQRRLDGVYIWAWNWVGGGHPWNDFDAPVMDWMLSYRDLDDSYVPTPAWEGIREGVDDLRYLHTLQVLLDSQPSDYPPAEQARGDLERLRGLLVRPDADLDKIQIPRAAPFSNDRSTAGTARRIIAGHIINLTRDW